MDIRFGNLTTQTGQQIKFEDFDKNGDGTISEKEYEVAIKEYGLDSVELSTLDKDGDKELSNEEFQIWEQKIKMEETLQPYLRRVLQEFVGSQSRYASEMAAALKNLIDTYAEEYMMSGENVSGLSKSFANALPS